LPAKKRPYEEGSTGSFGGTGKLAASRTVAVRFACENAPVVCRYCCASIGRSAPPVGMAPPLPGMPRIKYVDVLGTACGSGLAAAAADVEVLAPPLFVDERRVRQ
jgi:hypothetical protein